MNKIELLKILNFKNDLAYLNEVKSILDNYSEITQILNVLDEIEKMKFCFLNKKDIHDILYEKEKFILIDKIYFLLSYNFHLNILIKDNIYLINYIYAPELINELDKLNRNNNNQLQKLIFSKFIVDLINNAKGFNFIDDNTKNSLTKIKKTNLEKIKNNINILKEYKLNYNIEEFVSKKIDEIYTKLIINLIKDIKFEKCKSVIRKLIQLDLKNIEITKSLCNKLIELLKSNEIEINYRLKKIKDLDKNKINFYYILLKYILKSPIFIYNCPILSKAKKFFIKIIKEHKKEDLGHLMNYYYNKHYIVERLEFIIKTLADSDYYYDKYLGLINNEIANKKNNELLKYKNISGCLEKYDYFYYFTNIWQKFSIIINIYFTKNEMIINYDFNIYYYENKINYEHLIDIKNDLLKMTSKNEKEENFIKFFDFLDMIKESLINLYKGKQNIKIKIDFKRNLNDLNSIYSFFSEKNKKYFSYKDENILNNEFNINQGFSFLLIDLNDDNNEFQNNLKQKIIDITMLVDNNVNQNEFQIMKFIYIIGNHEKGKMIKQLSNGFYLIIGETFFSLYGLLNNIIVKKYEFGKKINNILEYGKSTDIINLLISIQNKIKIITIDIKRLYKNYVLIKLQDYNNINCLYAFEIEICGLTNIIRYYNDKNDKVEQNQIIISDYSDDKYIYIGKIELKAKELEDADININNHIIDYTKNKIMNENIIVLKQICKNKNEDNEEIKNYILNSENSLCFMPKKINELLSLLLISYNYKENDNKKYGILLNFLSPDKTILSSINIDTGEFKINCFCPILLIENNNIITYNLENYKNIEISSTNYFIAGGYDYGKKEGKLKLFEIYKGDTGNINMKEKCNIIPKNFTKFENSIISMIQSIIDGQIIILDSSGNVYYFTSPEIKSYIQSK